MSRLALGVLGACLLIAARAEAQVPPQPPATYALTNARVVTAPGRVIERGTVVVRAGRIVAVGADVAIPADAVKLELSGKTIYAGLVDAANSVGLPRAPQAQGGFGFGAPAAPAAAPGGGRGREEGAPELQPARQAAHVFTASDSVLAGYRAAGFTTLGLAFDGGIFPGQTSVLSLGGAADGPAMLRSPVALQVVFGRRRGGYPGTLMGAIAYIKQSFHDAQHDHRVRQAFERNPSGGPRPAYDAEHTALVPAATGAQPVWIAATRENDIRRAVALAQELKLDYALLGAQEGWRAAELLKREGRPVLLSLDYPRVDQVTGRAFELRVAPVNGKDEQREDADSAAARALRANAAELARAGVPFALTGFGLRNGSELVERVRGAVQAGLSQDDALRALTVTPARMLGLERALGTIEPGKLANLLVTEGNLFDKDAKVRHVFIEGRRYDIRETPRSSERSERGGAGRGGAPGGERGRQETARATGSWEGTVVLGDGQSLVVTLEITARGDQLEAQISSEMGSARLTGRQTGNEILLDGQYTAHDGRTGQLSLTGRVEGDELEATITLSGEAPIAFRGTRTSPRPPDAQDAATGGAR